MRIHLHHLTLMNGEKNICIELHWDITLQGFIDIPHMWDYADAVEVNKYRFNVLKPEYNFAYLLVHGALHKWFRLFWLLDIAVIIRNEPCGFERILDILEKNRLERPFMSSMILLKLIYNFNAPFNADRIKFSRRAVKKLTFYGLKCISRSGKRKKTDICNRIIRFFTDRWNPFYNEFILKKGYQYRKDVVMRRLIKPDVWDDVDIKVANKFMHILMTPFLWLRKIIIGGIKR